MYEHQTGCCSNQLLHQQVVVAVFYLIHHNDIQPLVDCTWCCSVMFTINQWPKFFSLPVVKSGYFWMCEFK